MQQSLSVFFLVRDRPSSALIQNCTGKFIYKYNTTYNYEAHISLHKLMQLTISLGCCAVSTGNTLLDSVAKTSYSALMQLFATVFSDILRRVREG